MLHVPCLPSQGHSGTNERQPRGHQLLFSFAIVFLTSLLTQRGLAVLHTPHSSCHAYTLVGPFTAPCKMLLCNVTRLVPQHIFRHCDDTMGNFVHSCQNRVHSDSSEAFHPDSDALRFDIPQLSSNACTSVSLTSVLHFFRHRESSRCWLRSGAAHFQSVSRFMFRGLVFHH